MKVWKDWLTGEEFFSDAKAVEPVEGVDGLVCTVSIRKSEAGVAVDTGTGDAFGGGGEDEGVDECDEIRLDQFWAFENIYNEVFFDSFKDFLKQYFKLYLKGVQMYRERVEGDSFDKDAFQVRMKGIADWLKKNFSSLQFFTLETFMHTDDESGRECVCNLAYLIDAEDARFYFVEGGFYEEKF